MRKQQDIADNELEIKQTLIYVVHTANICKIWGDDCNNTPILAFISSWTLF